MCESRFEVSLYFDDIAMETFASYLKEGCGSPLDSLSSFCMLIVVSVWESPDWSFKAFFTIAFSVLSFDI